MKKITLLLFLISNLIFSQKEVTADKFGYIINDSLFMSFENYKFGIFDIKGNQIVENKLTKTQHNLTLENFVSENIIFAKDNSKSKLIAFNLTTKKTIAEGFNNYINFSEGIAFIQYSSGLETTVYAIDRNGNKLFSLPNVNTRLNFEKFGKYKNGLARILITYEKNKEKTVYIDKTGKIVIDNPNYLYYQDFSEGLARVCKLVNGTQKWGFINNKGEEVIECKFTKYPTDFSDSFSRVQSKTKLYGYINNQGTVIIEPKYKYASGFYKGLALVNDSYKKWHIIDKTGKIIYNYENRRIVKNGFDFNYQATTVIKQIVDSGIIITRDDKYKIKTIDLKNNNLFIDKPWKIDYCQGKYCRASVKGNPSSLIIDSEGNTVLIKKASEF